MPEATRPLPVRVDVRLTESEREFLTQEAIKRDMSRQDLMRKLLLSELDSVEPVKDYKPVVVSQGRDSIDRAMAAVLTQHSSHGAVNRITAARDNNRLVVLHRLNRVQLRQQQLAHQVLAAHVALDGLLREVLTLRLCEAHINAHGQGSGCFRHQKSKGSESTGAGLSEAFPTSPKGDAAKGLD